MRSLLDLVLMDLYECVHDRLLFEQEIRIWLLEAAKLMGAEVVADNFFTFKPWGVSGTVTIAESHLAVHTWPEYNFAAITFETCGQGMDHQKAYLHLVEKFGSKKPKIIFQKRGFIEEAVILPHYRQGGDNICQKHP